MISVVLEAAKQVVESGKTASAFKMREVSFSAAISLSEDVPTELIVQMRPHLVATSGATPATWWEFSISSAAGPTSQMRNNCRGLITIVYEEEKSHQMASEQISIEEAQIADYHRILQEYPKVVAKVSRG